MPAQETNKTIILEHPSGSKAEVALFGKVEAFSCIVRQTSFCIVAIQKF